MLYIYTFCIFLVYLYFGGFDKCIALRTHNFGITEQFQLPEKSLVFHLDIPPPSESLETNDFSFAPIILIFLEHTVGIL